MSALPPSVRDQVGQALRRLGAGSRVASVEPAGGGCINHGARIENESGRRIFLKWNADVPSGFFEAEADGLRALRAREALRVPEPLAWGGGEGGPSWLLLEYVDPGPGSNEAQARLGQGLARIHEGGSHEGFGWHRDNWIGSLPQANTRSASWGVFWCDLRLLPQLERARAGGHLHDAVLDRVVELAAAALQNVRTPELLHGDLWSGNAYASRDGEAVLVDPAVYEGHGEVDLAMADLFGGFTRPFWDAYAATRGISAEFLAYRKDLYQLYYLLVHVNLFGGSYEPGCVAAARRVVAELG